jgi:hypothetical protein
MFSAKFMYSCILSKFIMLNKVFFQIKDRLLLKKIKMLFRIYRFLDFLLKYAKQFNRLMEDLKVLIFKEVYQVL